MRKEKAIRKVTMDDLIEKAQIDFENFQYAMLLKSKEEIFNESNVIRDYKYLLELITERKIELAGNIVLIRLYNSPDCLKKLYEFWITEDLPGFEDDEMFFLTTSLKELR